MLVLKPWQEVGHHGSSPIYQAFLARDLMPPPSRLMVVLR